MPWLALASAAAPVIGGLIGQGQASSDRTRAENARKDALAQYASVKAPSVEDQMLALQQYQQQGTINPLLEQLISQGNTGLNDVQLDPRLKAGQMDALQQISGLASGQIQPGDQAAFELARRNSAGEVQAKQGQILQDMQQRGQAGSGAELLARLKSAQSGADMLSQADMQQAQSMQQARMAALSQQANVSGNIRQQDYGQQSDLSRAQDAINQFNSNNAQNVQGRNVQSQNNAQATNLSNKQGLMNANVDIANKQQANNKGLLQTQFSNQLGLANGMAGQYNQQADGADKQAAQTAAMWGGIGQGVGTAVGGYAAAQTAAAKLPVK